MTDNEIELEEFEAWRAHPITKALMARAAASEALAKTSWLMASWGLGPDQMSKLPTEKLAYLRGKADAYRRLSKMEYKNIFKGEV